jgi:hypothetical protein
VPKDGQLGRKYFDQALPIVDVQLSKAGIRLAAMLNAIFGNGKGLPTGSALAAEKAYTGPFVGSRTSQVYHYPSCRDVRMIKPDNLVKYDQAPSGRRLHQGCPR